MSDIGLKGETDACIEELEWFATRKKDLSASIEAVTDTWKGKTWGDMLLSDIADLRKALAAEREGTK